METATAPELCELKEKSQWLNRNILTMRMTSFFSDFGHEMATAILPAFLVSLGGSAALLGIIGEIADASISGMKLLSGWYSDHLGKKKPPSSNWQLSMYSTNR